MVFAGESNRSKPGIETIFVFSNELRKTFDALTDRVSPEVVLTWLQKQTEFVLSEFGVGESLSIQPPTWQLVRLAEENLQVKSAQAAEYGDQLPSFLLAEGFPEPVREGLFKVYHGLAQANVGDGFVRYSPTEFYKHLDSKFDVLEFYRVVEKRDDGSRLIESRYVLLDIFDSCKRAYIVNYHGQAGMPIDADPSLLIASPQAFTYGQFALRAADPITAHARLLANRFQKQFGHSLLAGEDDQSLYKMIENLTARHISGLRNLLMSGDGFNFIKKLEGMILESQFEWAKIKGIDPRRHLDMILSGMIAVGGVEGSLTFNNLQDTLTNLFKSFLDEFRTKNHCQIHGDYEGESCPGCSRII
ncbi:hypothetical protein A2160_03335 [Candidatus Beckwithbacteria bacterium RBG_13_42_9]|uniref:Uncharacterized protein n=1 Tax=Candidatus Beckwithbacteria bacterium RBG_13_42_9 TaxID=1797457 RepID=A0A1F5E9F4_9BACT|nr:MAG: hypothetical protein A2160_03335 [Candidatus Beckwithbacteria bacterium RBG_13_42_9]